MAFFKFNKDEKSKGLSPFHSIEERSPISFLAEKCDENYTHLLRAMRKAAAKYADENDQTATIRTKKAMDCIYQFRGCTHTLSALKSRSPYVCTVHADFPIKMFGSFGDWFDHEIQEHRWHFRCRLCREKNAFYTKVWHDKPAFLRHLDASHNINGEEEKAQNIAESCSMAPDGIPASACLLCDDWKAEVENPKDGQPILRLHNDEGEDDGEGEPCGLLLDFRCHLGRHLEQLALWALPESSEFVNGTDDNDVTVPKDDTGITEAEGGGELQVLEPIETSSPIPRRSRRNTLKYVSHFVKKVFRP